MKKISQILIAALLVTIISFSSCSNVKTKEVTLNTLSDSINYTLALWQGDVFKEQYFANDEDGKLLKAFIQSLDKAYGSKEEPNEMYELGLNVGRFIKSNSESGFFGDSTLVGNQDLILAGLINAIKDYQEVMTGTQADSIVQTTQMKIAQRQQEQQFLQQEQQIQQEQQESQDPQATQPAN